MNEYEKGFYDGCEWMKTRALDVLCDCPDVNGAGYIEVRDAIKKLPLKKEQTRSKQ